MGFLIVFIGGGIGAALRHGFNLVFARAARHGISLRNLFENVTGSVVMGLLVALFRVQSGIPQHWQLFLTTGILGGYTTFSTFSLDAALLYERGEIGLAALYVLRRLRCRSAGCSPASRSCAVSPNQSIGRMPSLSSSAMSWSRPGLGVVSSFGP